MKYNTILFLLVLLYGSLYAQSDRYIAIGLTTGTGASIQIVNLGNVAVTDDMGNIISVVDYKLKTYGYHIPVSIPIMYGTKKWRLGLDIGYEYINILKVREADYPNGSTQQVQYTIVSDKFSYHLIKVGAIFEYDFWAKKKSALGINAELGYYAIAKYTYSTDFYKAPFLYGTLGLQASYILPKGFRIVYGIGLDVQGNDFRLPDTKHADIFYQPRLTIGFRKNFLLKSKIKK